jgi:kynurenine 3-monooxygenase
MHKTTNPQEIAVMGAGLVGSLMSIYLKRMGHEVSIYERRGDMRKEKVDGGRSINLAMSDRGLRALAGVGLDKEIKDISIPMSGRMIHFPNGDQGFQPYGKEGQAINSVSRAELNIRLMDVAEKEGVKINYENQCLKVRSELPEVKLKGPEGPRTINPDRLLGADGAFSAMRSSMQKTPLFNYSQQYEKHGYKELVIPPAEDGGWRIEKNALHIWPRESFMLIALPNLDGSFTCTLFAPFEGENGLNNVKTEADVIEYFNLHFEDAVEHMPTLIQDFMENPTSTLVTVKCDPWNSGGKSLLIGDASHAIVPFYGQGMNSGFEDCTLLAEAISNGKEDWEAIFENFSKTRKPNADAIADLALDNFVEMRDKVGDRKFLYRKQIEKKISETWPEKYTPAYSLVTFSHMPYAEAQRLAYARNEILNAMSEIHDINDKWESKEVKALLEQLFGVK